MRHGFAQAVLTVAVVGLPWWG